MIITWTPTSPGTIDSFGCIIDWVGEYETFVILPEINLYFLVGEYVYLIGCGNKKYKITSYLGDNEHYILNNKIRVSYTQISRNYNFNTSTSQLDKLLAMTPDADPTPVRIYKNGQTSNNADIIEKLSKAKKRLDNLNNI